MKKIIQNTLTLATLFFATALNAQVGVGVPAENIHPSAELEVKSNTKGFLPPRMTMAERDAIVTPAAGLLIYQTDGDVSGLYYFDGKDWKNGLGVQGIKGDKGETGAVGAQGPQGEPGTSSGNASSASQVSTTQSASSNTFYPSFAPSSLTSSSSSLFVDNGLSFIPATNTLSATNINATSITGNLTGTASSASQVAVTNSFSTGTNYLSFSPSINGVSDLKTNPSLTFNPGTGNLSVPFITASNITGSLTGNATSASKIALNNSSTSVTNYLSFSPSTDGVSDLQTDYSLTFIPSTNTLSVPFITASNITGSLTGNATSASKVAVTSTTVAADRYLCFTPNTSSGNADLQINSLSQGLKYNPGTGVLTVPSIKTPTGTSSQYLMADGSVSSVNPQGAVGPAGPKGDTGEKGEPGKDGVSGTSGQSVLFNPTTPPTNGMVVYKYFQNNTTTTLYDDGQIRLRLNIGSGKLYLTNVNKNIPNIFSNIGTLSSAIGSSMNMAVGNGYFQNFGTAAVAMGTEMNLYSNLFTSNNYVMTMYISAPDNPSYGLYVINIYFNAPTSSLNYSNMTVNYYKDPTATP